MPTSWSKSLCRDLQSSAAILACAVVLWLALHQAPPLCLRACIQSNCECLSSVLWWCTGVFRPLIADTDRKALAKFHSKLADTAPAGSARGFYIGNEHSLVTVRLEAAMLHQCHGV